MPAAATPERFKLYERYQEIIHKDRPGKNTMSGFNRFLCRSPLGVSQCHERLVDGVGLNKICDCVSTETADTVS